MSGPWSVPVGSTGSLLLGCHAYPLSVECSVRPDGAKTEEFIKKIKIYKKNVCVWLWVCVKDCLLHSPPGQRWKSVVVHYSWADILECPLEAPIQSIISVINSQCKDMIKAVCVSEPGCGPCVVGSVLQVCWGPEMTLRWRVHSRSTLRAGSTHKENLFRVMILHSYSAVKKYLTPSRFSHFSAYASQLNVSDHQTNVKITWRKPKQTQNQQILKHTH